MKRYEVLLSETVRRQLRALPTGTGDRIKRALAELGDHPFRSRSGVDIKRLKGPGRDYFRMRIGDYRAIYVVEGHRELVAKIIRRSEAYKWLD